MKWVLIYWIFGCYGLKCDIPEYEARVFHDESTCNFALELWVKTERGKHRGICITKEFYDSIDR
jgi:hypothetical protein